jgi:hypothetical protein
MIYTGDVKGFAGIKLAKGNSWSDWSFELPLLADPGPSGLDVQKETPFYHYAKNGKHQIYYIGYPDNDNYESQLYLAEADELTGPYVQKEFPVISRGLLAGKQVHLITSPSIVEHQDKLFLTFLAWNDFHNVTMVWVLGAVSDDYGNTWSQLQEVDVPIGMEGQVTRMPDGTFCAVRTGEFKDKEAIWYSTALHPFGPWETTDEPILIQAGVPWEVNEIIAPQITFNPETQEPVLYYTGSDHQKGWWIMMAEKE